MRQKKFMHTWTILLLLGIASTTLQAQTQDLSYKAGDRVCFVGNSITHTGYYWSYIVLYYATRFPDRHIDFFNCGVSGDTADGILRRMDKDILSNNPTAATVMIGMNDVKRSDYAAKMVADKEQHQKNVAATFAFYKQNTTAINQILSSKVRELILFTPSIYDQSSTAPTNNLKGVNDCLYAFGELTKREAPKYKARVVDFWGKMNRVNTTLQQQDPQASVIGKDRVHPEQGGGMIMAYQFLKESQLPKTVSQIAIDASQKQSSTNNGTLSEIQIKRNAVSFDFLSKALPFPTTQPMTTFTHLYPFHEEFNQELLIVSGLSKGTYELSIDNTPVGQYPSTELQKGINLAQNDQTPQYKQALQVLQTVERFRSRYATHQNLRLVEHFSLKGYEHIDNPDSCIAKAASLYEQAPHKETYLPKQYKFYVENKKKQQQMWNDIRDLNKAIYQKNKPTKHTYRLTKLK